MFQTTPHSRSDDGFTLVEIIIAIVLVGILSTVVVVGVSSLLATGGAAGCTASADGARAAAMAYWSSTANFPDTFTQMTGASTPFLELPDTVTVDAAGTAASTPDWTLTLTPTAGAPLFECGAGTRTAPPSDEGGTAACPGQYDAWVGEYYGNISLTGTPTVCRNDTAVDFNWALGSPDPTIVADDFSVRWTRVVEFTAGDHIFTVGSDDGHRLLIDGVRVLDTWHDRSYGTRSTTQTLTAGTHLIVLEFYERGGYARSTLAWT